MVNQIVLSGQITKLFPGDRIGSISLKSVSTYTYNGETKERILYSNVSCTNLLFTKLRPDQEVVLIGRLESFKSGEIWKLGIFASEIYPISSSLAQDIGMSINVIDNDEEETDVPF